MKVLFLTNHFIDTNGGGSFASRAFANAFAEISEECLLVYPDRGNNISSYISNKYKLKGRDIYFFNIYYIRGGRYGNLNELQTACAALNEKMVPLLRDNYVLKSSIPELVELSKGKSVIADTLREGVVIRPLNEVVDCDLHCNLVRNRVSFKSVNPEFLLKHGE